MKDSLTPEAILTDFLNRKLNAQLAIDLLTSLLEKSNNPEMRKKSIYAIKNVEGDDEKIFKILENCLLSDENPSVRMAAAQSIGQSYLKYGLKTLRWVIQNDKSPILLKTIINMAENENYQHFNSITKEISNWLKKFSKNIGVFPEESIFFLDLEVIFAQDQSNYIISPLTYNYYKKIRRINDPKPWLIINDNHVESLNFNFFNWYFLKKNQDIIDSFLNIENLDSFLQIYKKFNIINFENLSVPKSIKYLSSLKQLKLSSNNIKNFPIFLTKLQNLEELDLSHNIIQEIPIEIMNLKKLFILKLNNNRIQKIPNQIMHFLESLQLFQY